jgi:hypothetical protein
LAIKWDGLLYSPQVKEEITQEVRKHLDVSELVECS